MRDRLHRAERDRIAENVYAAASPGLNEVSLTAAAFDTLKLARTLRDKAKLSPEQAEGFADAMAEILQGDMATKGDVQAVKVDLRETELRLKAEIEASKAEIIKWIFGTIGFQSFLILGAVVALARFIKP